VTSYFETENEHVDFILPIMTVPFDFKKRQWVRVFILNYWSCHSSLIYVI